MRLLNNIVSEEKIMSMNYLYIRTFFEEVDAAAESNLLYNEYNCSVMKVEISDATAISAKVQGRIDSSADWVDLNVRPVGSTSVNTTISAKGIYSVDVAGIAEVRIKVASITGTAKIVGSLAN